MQLEPSLYYAVNMWTKEVDVSVCFECVFGAISHGNDRSREEKGPYAPWKGAYIMNDPQFKIPDSLPIEG